MRQAPRTKEEAKGWRYGKWAGCPGGTPYDPERCAYEVHDSFTYMFRQCIRKPGHGPDSLFCSAHAKKEVEAILKEVAR